MTLMEPGRDFGGEQRPGAMALALYGCLYWFMFVLVLEPDNVLRAWRARQSLSFPHEAIRIAGAALLGAAATPVQLGLTRRFPLGAERTLRNLLIHAGGAAVLAGVLVVLGCIVAAWIFEGQALPSFREMGGELAANWTLLMFAVGGFTAVVQLLHLDRRWTAEHRVAKPDRSRLIQAGSGARLYLIELEEIDWIESQGNYVALHTGPKAHLVRRTLTSLETDLNNDRFVRIHRGAIVATDRIRAIEPLTNGDAVLTLEGGRALRVSRSHRDEVRRRWLTA